MSPAPRHAQTISNLQGELAAMTERATRPEMYSKVSATRNPYLSPSTAHGAGSYDCHCFEFVVMRQATEQVY